MARSRLDAAAFTFKSSAEVLHEKFLAISADSACTGCQSAGFGEAILAAWLQTSWGDFTRELIIASALGTRRQRGTSFSGIVGVRTRAEAQKVVKATAARTVKANGFSYPVWHSPSFVIDVGSRLGLKNFPQLESTLAPTRVPRQITDFRNYLVHPGDGTRQKYEALQAKLGMHRTEPEHLLHQFQAPGLTVFTSWIRELQRIADYSTR